MNFVRRAEESNSTICGEYGTPQENGSRHEEGYIAS